MAIRGSANTLSLNPVSNKSAPHLTDQATRQLGALDVFEGELDEQTLVISDYIQFCIDTLIPAKTIKTYPNSKPWINPQIKHFFYKKQLAFRQKDFAGLKIINRDIKREIYKAKQHYTNKL